LNSTAWLPTPYAAPVDLQTYGDTLLKQLTLQSS